MQVAFELTEHDALAAHTHDELRINEIAQAKPLQAAVASFASFALGALLRFGISLLVPIKQMVYFQYGFYFFYDFGSSFSIGIAMLRICFWGTVAMGITALVGHFFGVNIS